jgi:hypothetical protein
MFKRIAVSAAIVFLGASFAAAAPAKATVTTVQDKMLVLKVEGERAPWMKKGVMVRINKKFNGKITEVTDAALTVSSPNAGEFKAGEAITIDKSLAAAGC